MVVVTGMGVIAATGSTLEEYADCVFHGRSAIGSTGSMRKPSRQAPCGGVVHRIPCPANVDVEAWHRWDRVVRMSLVAALEATSAAGLSRRKLSETPTALFVGTSLGGIESQMAYQRALLEDPTVDPSPLGQAPLHAVAEETAAFLDLSGPRLTLSNACVSGSNCIGLALDLIREGRVERALCIGVDGFHEFTFTGFASLWALAQEGMRPFDRKRGGMLLGEAAAAIVLENVEAARARKAPIHAEVAGYGLGGDAVHVSAPDRQGGGLVRAMTMALRDARVTAADVGYVNANATGSGYGDASEAQALRKVFGARADTLPVSSVKQITGHTLGAAGILEAIVSVLTIERGLLPPNANLTDLADDCPLGRVLRSQVKVAPPTVLSNSTGFGGATACLVFRPLRCEAPRSSLPAGEDAGGLGLGGRGGEEKKGKKEKKEIGEPAGTPVAITGIGVLSSLGKGREAHTRALLDGKIGFGPCDRFSTEGLPSSTAALVRDFSYRNFVTTKNKRTKKMDDVSQMVVATAWLALRDAGILDGQGPLDEALGDGFGVVTASAAGSLESIWEFQGQLVGEGPDGVDPKVFPNTSINVPAAHVSIEFGLRGPMLNLVSGPVAGIEAIGVACSLISSGRARRVLVGGYDRICEPLYRALSRLGALSPADGTGAEGARPFGEGANGLVLGEGSCFLLLETPESASERGARILGRISGFGSAAHPVPVRHVANAASGKEAIKEALRAASVEAEALVGVVSGAAGGSTAVDDVEARAIKEALGPLGASLGIYPLKAQVGEVFGSFGPMAIAVAVASYSEEFDVEDVLAYERSDEVPFPLKGLCGPPGGPVLVCHCAPGGQAAALVVEPPVS